MRLTLRDQTHDYAAEDRRRRLYALDLDPAMVKACARACVSSGVSTHCRSQCMLIFTMIPVS